MNTAKAIVRLTQWASCAGCAAKMDAQTLAEVVRRLPATHDPNLLVGMETGDDAGVYRIAPDLALVNTVDFFPPIVDDPYDFGRIAAANALSDVYAMGARPLTAMNLVAFPKEGLAIEVLHEILRGGSDKLAEAGVAMVGGHSVTDPGPKYGLAVTGLVDPARVVTNAGASPGDSLVLTKPIGVGIITTALKQDVADARAVVQAVESMAQLNRRAFSSRIHFDVAVSEIWRDLLFDPQTSGGLLIALPAAAASQIVELLAAEGYAGVAVIGGVESGANDTRIVVE